MTQQATRTLQTADGPLDLYEARPDGKPKAAVIVIQEAFGVNDHIMDVTRRFAAAGYHAVAPTMFHRAGGGTAPYGDMSKVVPLFKGMSDDAIVRDVDAALAQLHADGFRDEQIGLVGFCFGGRVSFLVATRRTLGACVGFYGGGIVSSRLPIFPTLIGDSAKLQSPWLGVFGDKDAGIPVADVEQLRAALRSDTKTPNEIVRYANADHGFFCDDRHAVYNDAAAKDGWARTLDWFGKYLAK
jgi:carboxymethylenebutenolidase